jgi:hypothetical protein
MLSHRLLLKAGLLAGGGLMLGLRLPSLARAADTTPDSSGRFSPNAFLRIDPSGGTRHAGPAAVRAGLYRA